MCGHVPVLLPWGRESNRINNTALLQVVLIKPYDEALTVFCPLKYFKTILNHFGEGRFFKRNMLGKIM